MRKSVAYGIVSAAMSVCLTTLGLELAVRVYRAGLLQPGGPEYHPRLGWIPKPGQVRNDGWTSNVDECRVRSNGRSIATASRPILAVGDSFAFGDEVDDGETWPAYLEEILNKRVINAGVGGYGIDQAFLRAELLLDEYDPDVVILSLISDDINRTELSHYSYGRGWKPYFEYEDGALVLRNVPVPPQEQEPIARSFQALHRVLGYSVLADAVFNRIAREWWQDLPAKGQIHHDGEEIGVELLVRLASLTKSRRGQFIAIALATNGRIGGNARLPNFVRRARENGVEVLDLSTEVLKLLPSEQRSLFRRGGHYSPAMNRSVAEHIAAFLRERRIRSPSEQPRTVS